MTENIKYDRTCAFAARVRNGGRRFTLVELMVALAMALIIGAVAVTALTQTSGVTSLAHARIDAMHNARAGVAIIESDLRSAYIEPGGEIFSGEEDWLEMLTVSGRGGTPGPMRVRYDLIVGEGGGNEDRVLFRSAFPARYGESPARGIEEVDVGENSFTIAGDHSDYINTDDNVAVRDSNGNDGLYTVQHVAVEYDGEGEGEGEEGEARTVVRVHQDVVEEEADGYMVLGDVVAFNVTEAEFGMRYYHGGQTGEWSPDWDSESDPGSFQYRRLPQVVKVVIQTVDDKGLLLREENDPIHLRRLIEIGAGLTR